MRVIPITTVGVDREGVALMHVLCAYFSVADAAAGGQLSHASEGAESGASNIT